MSDENIKYHKLTEDEINTKLNSMVKLLKDGEYPLRMRFDIGFDIGLAHRLKELEFVFVMARRLGAGLHRFEMVEHSDSPFLEVTFYIKSTGLFPWEQFAEMERKVEYAESDGGAHCRLIDPSGS